MAKLLPALEGANRHLAEWYLSILGSGAPLPLDHNCNEIAKEVGVSRATVIRFARALGYSGFASLRNALYHYAGNIKDKEQLNRHSIEKPPCLVNVTALYTTALATSLQAISSAAFEEAVRWLANATFVLWIGWGDSSFVAASGEHKCRLAGFTARSANDVADLGLHVAALPKDAVIVVVSQSGRWQVIADSLQAAKERGIRVICLTGQAGSILERAADLSFVTANPTLRVAGHPFTLRSAQTALVDALILEATVRVGKHSVEFPEAVRYPLAQQDSTHKMEA
jgi:DNA-binding MurR/RpiR family transcriptional regulator